jgi:RNA polymerase sigma-70 factor, ECF subfamily
VRDSSQFRELFDTHVAFVWRVLQRHGVPVRELEDACQEVFLVVHTRIAEFEGRSSIRTWIYGVALRVALSFRRKGYRVREQLGEELPETSAEPEQLSLVEQRQTLGLIERALGKLAEPKREVFALYELEGMTIAEVASALGIPENTVFTAIGT